MKEKVLCENCERKFEREEMYEVDGLLYCEDCFCELFSVCPDCGEVIPVLEAVLVNSGFNDERYVCESCIEDGYFRCTHCEEYFSNNHLWAEDSEYVICDSCSDYYYVCAGCNEIIHQDDAEYHDGNYYCSSCYDDVCDNLDNVVNEYSYKPIPIFLGDSKDNLYIGVELEVDRGSPYDAAVELKDSDNIYLKHDGSLGSGFEIVSHPATLEYHTHYLGWSEIMQICLSADMRSHDTSTCGLHCHVSRDFFGSNSDTQDLHIAKLILLINKFWDRYIVPFSRRDYSQLDRWAAKPDISISENDTEEEIVDKVKSSKHNGRYQGINLMNEHTIEFRMFRGTLKLNTFIASLQFVDCICRFAKDMKLSGIYSTNWSDLFYGKATQYPELICYLKSRNLL